MRKPKIVMTILKEDVGYGAICSIGEIHMATCADTFEELKEMILECVNLAFEDLGFVYTFDEIKLDPDLESFYKFYSLFNLKALSDRIGIDRQLLGQYLKGIKKPSPVHKRKILNGVQKLGKELAEIEYLA